jgi:hypothetical protein
VEAIMTRNRIATIQDVFYWAGVALAFACLLLLLAGNTEIGWRLEHANLPVSWLAGALAILAFLAAEYLDSTEATPAEVDLQIEMLELEA